MTDINPEEFGFNKNKIIDWFKLAQIFVYTPFTYIGWYYLVINTPDIAVDNSATVVVIFWMLTVLFFILLSILIYLPFFKYSQTNNTLNKTQIVNFIGTSVFSVFFWSGIFYWHTFIFYSKSIEQAFGNLLIFSMAILGSVGIVQLWFSTLAMQVVIWIKRKTVN